MGFFEKIKSGLSRTRDSLGSVFSFSNIDDDFYDELEENLILADLGAATAMEAVEQLREKVKREHLKEPGAVREALREILAQMLQVGDSQLRLGTRPSVILMIGVNGVGKTTTIGKLAGQLHQQGKKVLLCAADTFRAAAADQLEVWAGRANAEIIRQDEGADPASVVFDAISAAKARGADVILCDTAGRLHNKQNLMNELSKISRIIDRELPGCDKGGPVGARWHHRPKRAGAGTGVSAGSGTDRHCAHKARRHSQGRHCDCRGKGAAGAREVRGRRRTDGRFDGI